MICIGKGNLSEKSNDNEINKLTLNSPAGKYLELSFTIPLSTGLL